VRFLLRFFGTGKTLSFVSHFSTTGNISMHAFEQLGASLLTRTGYWVYPSFKVELTKEDKVAIGKPSSPRWELDLLAYKPSENSLIVVECKAYLDSTGTTIHGFNNPRTDRYKLFNDENLRKVVFFRMLKQLSECGLILQKPKVSLALMTAKIRKSDQSAVADHFDKNGWLLFDAKWIRQQLQILSEGSYENDVASVVAKLLNRSDNG
jgi:hypothetical protein